MADGWGRGAACPPSVPGRRKWRHAGTGGLYAGMAEKAGAYLANSRLIRVPAKEMLQDTTNTVPELPRHLDV